jgi:hypothetical protein
MTMISSVPLIKRMIFPLVDMLFHSFRG